MMTRVMRMMAAGAVILAAGISGCVGDSLAHNSKERAQIVVEVNRRDRQAILHDLDLLFQTDRPTRLSPWHDR